MWGVIEGIIMSVMISITATTSLNAAPVLAQPLTAPLPARAGSEVVTPEWLLIPLTNQVADKTGLLRRLQLLAMTPISVIASEAKQSRISTY